MTDVARLALEVGSCELIYAKEAIKAILHTILFHRCYGLIVPKTQEVLDLTLPAVDDAEIEALIEVKASEFASALRTSSSRGDTSSLVIEFYEKKVRKAWFSEKEEEVCWESWTVSLALVQPARTEAEKKEHLAALSDAIHTAVMKVITVVNDRNDEYIPPIPYSEGNPFPYQIFIQ